MRLSLFKRLHRSWSWDKSADTTRVILKREAEKEVQQELEEKIKLEQERREFYLSEFGTEPPQQ